MITYYSAYSHPDKTAINNKYCTIKNKTKIILVKYTKVFVIILV